jgi:macrolide-specific efflux system membrane fusion protein
MPYQVRVLSADGHAKRRQVWIGVSNRVSAEVLDGLAPGDVVVVGRRDDGNSGGPTGIRKLF